MMRPAVQYSGVNSVGFLHGRPCEVQCFGTISFSDWRNSAMEPFKRRLIEEIKVKFSYPPNIRPWIIQVLGTKWRGYKTNLKYKYWSVDRLIQKIVERVPDGVDPYNGRHWYLVELSLVTRSDEAELFEKSAMSFYKQSRDKAAFSRSMTVDDELLKEGYGLAKKLLPAVWLMLSGASHGLLQLQSKKANIPQDIQARLVEFQALEAHYLAWKKRVKEMLQDVASSGAVQARMDGVLLEQLENVSNLNQLFSLIKDYLSSF